MKAYTLFRFAAVLLCISTYFFQIHADPVGAIDAYVRMCEQEQQFAGTVLVARGDTVLFNKGYGLADKERGIANTVDTIFYVPGAPRSSTHIATFLLQEQGKLSFHDSLAKFIPNFPNGSAITINHLVQHTAGVANYVEYPDCIPEWPLSLHDLIKCIALLKPSFMPGEKYQYSHSGPALLTAIVEKVSGMDYGAFLKKYIFDAEGLVYTHWSWPKPGTPGYAIGALLGNDGGLIQLNDGPQYSYFVAREGGTHATALDQYRFMRARFASQSSTGIATQEVLKRLYFEDPSYRDGGYGLSLLSSPEGQWWYGRGRGFRCHVMRRAQDELYLVILSNREYTPLEQMNHDIVAIMDGKA